MKTIGILTSGGDAPGMNAAIRAITRAGLARGLKIKGIIDGYNGLMYDNVFDMDAESVDDILYRGGTILGTARAMEFYEDSGRDKAMEVIKKHGIDAIVVIGGDGSFMGAYELHKRGIRTIGIPGTIDNDMGYTEWTLGFFTACETVKENVGKLRDTSGSHSRANVVEVMGRNCGDIALYSGLSSGAEYILVPELPVDMDAVIERINETKGRGKRHHIVMVAEGLENSEDIRKQIEEGTGIETKLTVIGHVQRGGTPVMYDSLIGSEMGVRAIELLLEGQSSQALGIKNGKVFNMPITEAVKIKSKFDMELYKVANVLIR